MGIKSTALAITAFVLSANANAAIISTDWLSSGDNLITQDTNSGLEWLDLTATTNRSYNDISTKFGSGQEFDGWGYATQVQVAGLLDAFGGNNAFYQSGSTASNAGLFSTTLAGLWGDTWCAYGGCPAGMGYSQFVTADVIAQGNHIAGFIYDSFDNNNQAISGFVKLNQVQFGDTNTNVTYGAALVRSSVVPVPAAVWLFGSGLIGLIGLARR